MALIDANINLGAEQASVTPSGKELRIRRLSKTFWHQRERKPILSNINLTIASGEFVVLLGASGCGKSTLLRIISGLETPDPDAGTDLLLDGDSITGPGPDRGLVFQAYSSFPWLTAKHNVMFGLQFCISDCRERERIALEYLALVGLREYADYYPKSLSGGQQQRVAIARTLAPKPKLLLMDEPYAALDAQTRETQQAELLRIWQQTRPTILFVTHDLNEAAFLGKRVLVLGGRPATIIEEVDTEAALERRIALRRATSAQSMIDPVSSLPPELLANDNCQTECRGSWLRTQPEFYELIARLKATLPGQNADGPPAGRSKN